MRAHEHRAIGDAATGGALVNLGGDAPDERFWLTFGDVVALSGDFFPPGGRTETEVGPSLFALGRRAGKNGTLLGTRDEILGALKVMSVDESFADPRFEQGGQFAGLALTVGNHRTDVERRVRDRYLALAAVNDDHFVSPGHAHTRTGSGCPSARAAYRHLHRVALDEAWALGRSGGDPTRAMAREAAALHYLTDAFASGHLRTPVAAIRSHWRERYPGFWQRLQTKVASETASALRELSPVLRIVPASALHHRTESELRLRTEHYPQLSVGDLVARCFHDWDNTHGLVVDGGAVVFGDGRVDAGSTRELALAAVGAGIDDVEVAFALGRTGRVEPGQPLYEEVREATGASSGDFRAEARIPRPAESNAAQNWRADDVESLWASPMLGSRGATVGQALAAMLDPDGGFVRQLEALGHGLAGTRGVLRLPVVGRWLGDKCCQAYSAGFVAPLTRDPRAVILDLVGADGTGEATAARLPEHVRAKPPAVMSCRPRGSA